MYSPLVQGTRCSPPRTWQRTNITRAQAQEKGLIAPATQILSYDTTWHHNVPWRVLRDSWNLIYTFFPATVVRQLFDLYAVGNGTLRTYANLRDKLLAVKEAMGPHTANASSSTCEAWLTRLTNAEGQLQNSRNELTADDAEALGSIVAWQRFNIVEGPKEDVRVDDPGDAGFDDFRFVDFTRSAQFASVYRWYMALDGLVNRSQGLLGRPCDLAAFANDAIGIEDALRSLQPYADASLVSFHFNHWRIAPIQQADISVRGGVYRRMAKDNSRQRSL